MSEESFRLPTRLRGIEKSLIRQIFDRARPGSINLGLGEPDTATPDVIRQEGSRVALEEQNGYTSHAGLIALRELIASDYSHLSPTPDQIIVTAGSQEALYLALMTLVDAGDEVMMPDPGFVAYPAIVRMAGGKAVYYRLPAEKDFGFDAEEFRSKITKRTRVVICTSPSNPTGRAFTPEELRTIADLLRDTNAYIISDEIYRDIYFTHARPSSPSEFYDKTVVIGGLSKSLSMTGWRLGWLCAPCEVARAALVLHGYVTTCAATISQKAALARWTDAGSAASGVMRQTFHWRRDFLVEQIRSELNLRTVVPDGAFYLMVDTSAYGDSLRVAEALLDEGVITVPGKAFGAESAKFLRVSFCADEERLAEGVRRMKAGLNKL